MKFYALEGNRVHLDGGSMFGNCPRALWQKWVLVDADGCIPLACRSLLIPRKQGYVLLEAGVGVFFAASLAQRYGITPPSQHLLLDHLKFLGLTVDDISVVVLSHLHFDHAGGLFKPYSERKLLAHQPEGYDIFPQARYVMSKGACQRALNPHPRDRASYPEDLGQWLRCSLERTPERFELLSPPQKSSQLLGEDFEFLFSEGHTPAQLHTLWHAPQEVKVFFCGDLIPGVPWVHLPITAGYDRFPEKIVDEKEALYPRALKENWWFFYTHDPEVALSQLTVSDDLRYKAHGPLQVSSQGVSSWSCDDLG